MKKRTIYLLSSMMLLGLVFVACDDDETDKLTFDKNNVEILIEETTTVKVSGGVAPYTVEEADETVVTATVSGSDIALKGLKEGTTTVRVTDANGVQATIAVKVNEDPYEDEKGDATVRVAWDTFEKVQGTDAGIYTFIKGENKTVVFTWTGEAEGEAEADSFVLTLQDPDEKIGAEAETASTKESLVVVGELTLIVDGETTEQHDVASWRLVQAEPAEEGDADTYWVAFTANGKSGLFVAPLTAAEE
jgi:hypothetical protein